VKTVEKIAPHKFEAYIFDFDGVVVDTEKYHFASWNKAFSQYGAVLSYADYVPLKSTGKDVIIGAAERKCGLKFTDAQKAEIYRIKKAEFAAAAVGISEADMIRGVKELLCALRRLPVKTAVASSASTTKELMKRLDLDGYFDVALDGNANIKKKPAPDIFLAAAEALGVRPEKCVVFEDSAAGIDAAVAAGMAVVAVGIESDKALACISDFTRDNTEFIYHS